MTIATIRRVPVDLIIHSLAERFKESAEEFTDDALSLGLYACIDSNGLAEEWAVSGGVAQTAEWMATVITDCDSWREPTAAETRVAEVAVCKRLLVTACNLCVTQDAEDHTAATALVQAASRILGVGFINDRHAIAERDAARLDGKLDADAVQGARLQLHEALGYVTTPHTLRELIASVVAQRDSERVRSANLLEMRNDAVKENDKWRLWAAVLGGRQDSNEHDANLRALVMERFSSIKAECDAATATISKVRAIFDEALGTTKGATTFTLTDIAEEMALQRARFNKERDAVIKECDAARARADKAERTQADDAHAARVTLANAQSLLDKATRGRDSMCAERDRLRAQVDRMIAAMREDAPTAKTKPQPGDVVPWAEVEDGALYFNGDSHGAKFLAFAEGLWFWLYDADDRDLVLLLRGAGCSGAMMIRPSDKGTTLVARDLGIDPETWRQAMREWTANGNKPSPMR